MNYPHWWIADEMSQPSNPHPYCWREIKGSGRTNLGACIVHAEHNDPAAQHYALWQVAAFRLPVAQQKASGWWDTLPALHGHCPQDFLPPASDPQNFPVIRQKKTLALARALQVCVEASRARTGIQSQDRHPMWIHQGAATVYGIFDDPQWGQCYGSLLLEEELGPSPTPEEETTLLGKGEEGPQECQALPPDMWKSSGS